MTPELLKCRPKQILCPFCGEWHNLRDKEKWLSDYNNSHNVIRFKYCDNSDSPFADSYIYFKNNNCYYLLADMCPHANISLKGSIPISSMVEHEDEPIVTFSVPTTIKNKVGEYYCYSCNYRKSCNFAKLGDESDNHNIVITFGFKFYKDDYNKSSKAAILLCKEKKLQDYECNLKRLEQSLQKQESDLRIKEQSLQEHESILADKETQTQIKEEITMSETTKNGTTIKTLLFENSPKENLELVRTWSKKYKPVLKWAVPVAAVYAAHWILNSRECDLSVNNVAETCERKLGFKIAFLENQKALKELMFLGGIATSTYTAVQVFSGFFGNKNGKKEISTNISVEEIEADMTKLESDSKKFSFLRPMAENMLPIALSVILVYITLHKPKFIDKFANKICTLSEDFQIKVGVYRHLAKSFIADKFNIDLSDNAEQKKVKICIFLLGIMGVLAFLYGKKVLGNKSNSEAADEADNTDFTKSVTVFVEQAKVIVKKLAPTIYTYIITLLVSKKLLDLEEASSVLGETTSVDCKESTPDNLDTADGTDENSVSIT